MFISSGSKRLMMTTMTTMTEYFRLNIYTRDEFIGVFVLFFDLDSGVDRSFQTLRPDASFEHCSSVSSFLCYGLKFCNRSFYIDVPL